LFGVFGRQAGTASDFMRYSDALTKSRLVWNEQTLDQWLQDPSRLVPGNAMAFPGIPDARTRGDLIAYLKVLSEGNAPPAAARQGGMMGMMRAPSMPELKKADPDSQIKSLRHCRDTYFVTTADGKTHKLWEFNVRLKTDSSPSGPNRGQPVLVGVGMRGDRAAIVFAAPDEISAFVKQSCN
jgi:cytochrome c